MISDHTDDPLVISIAEMIQNVDTYAPDRDDDDCIDMAEAIIKSIKIKFLGIPE